MKSDRNSLIKKGKKENWTNFLTSAHLANCCIKIGVMSEKCGREKHRETLLTKYPGALSGQIYATYKLLTVCKYVVCSH